MLNGSSSTPNSVVTFTPLYSRIKLLPGFSDCPLVADISTVQIPTASSTVSVATSVRVPGVTMSPDAKSQDTVWTLVSARAGATTKAAQSAAIAASTRL